jgi:FkbM family methyltransferase
MMRTNVTRSSDELRAALDARRAAFEAPNRKPLPVMARLAAARALHLASRLTGVPIKVRTRTFWDQSIELVFPEVVSECIFRAGFYEAGLTTMLIEHIRPGNVFLDVGAHFGYFSLLASTIVGRDGQVHSFEPTPSTYRILLANVGGCANVSTVNQAMYSTPTTLEFNDYGVQYSAYNSLFQPRLRAGERSRVNATVHKVIATTMDDYVAARGLTPHFIKIDAENAELDVLRGAEKTLAGRSAVVTIEVGDDESVGNGRRSRDVIDHLTARGYEPLEFRDSRLVRHEVRDRYEYDNLLFVPKG